MRQATNDRAPVKAETTPNDARSLGGGSESSLSADAPRAVARIVNILSCIAETPVGATLSFLSREMDVPKSSLSNLLRGLVGAGYLANEGGIYALASESYRLAAAITRSSRLPEVSRSIIRGLTERTGETSLVAVLTPDDRVMYIDQVISSNTIAAQIQIGESRGLYDSAGGRVILAMLPPERVKAYFNTVKLDRLTEVTEVRRSKLKEILAEVRQQGFAITEGEAIMGLTGIAAPILDSSGAPVGSVIVTGPSDRFKPKLAEWAPLVRDAGLALSHFRGYSPRHG